MPWSLQYRNLQHLRKALYIMATPVLRTSHSDEKNEVLWNELRSYELTSDTLSPQGVKQSSIKLKPPVFSTIRTAHVFPANGRKCCYVRIMQ